MTDQISAVSTFHVSQSTPIHTTAFSLSLLKMGTVAQVMAGVAVTVSVIAATVVGTTVFVTSAKYSAPITNPDSVITYKHVPVAIYPLVNDKDPRGIALTISSLTNPKYGTVKLDPTSKIAIYSPQGLYAGYDYFNYTATNGKLDSTNTITVLIKNHAPIPVNQQYQVQMNSKNNVFNVFSYHSPINQAHLFDPDGDPLYVEQCTNNVQVQSSTFVNYTPMSGFIGSQVSNCSLTDLNSTVYFTITFQVVNSPPITNPDFMSIPKNTLANVNVMSNDYDPNGNPTNITWTAGTAYGQSIISENKQYITYIPVYTTKTVTDSFEYVISDGYGYSSSSYVVITLVNRPPVAYPIHVSVPKNNNGTMIVFIQCNNKQNTSYSYCDPDVAETLKINIPSQNTLSLLNLSVVYSPNPTTFACYMTTNCGFVELTNHIYSVTIRPVSNSVYNETVLYQVTDSGGLTCESFLSISVYNEAPVAPSINASVPKGSSTWILIIGNGPYDPDGDSVFLKNAFIDSTITKGVLVSNNKTYVLYQAPKDDSTSIDYFNYTVCDETTQDSQCANGTVIVSIYNLPPVAVDYTVNISKGFNMSIDVLCQCSDPDYDTIYLAKVLQSTANVIPTIVWQNSTTCMTPNEIQLSERRQMILYQTLNSVYTDQFQYFIQDQIGLKSISPATVTVHVFDNAPVARKDEYWMPWNTTLVMNVLSNDYDVNPGDFAILTIATITQNKNSAAIISGIGTRYITYQAAPGFIGKDIFTYQAQDQYLESNSATVTVYVYDQAPIAVNDTIFKHFLIPFVWINVLENDISPLGNPLAILNNSLSLPISIHNGVQQIQYSNPINFIGTQSFDYTITDWALQSSANVVVVVTDLAPVTVPDELQIHWSDKNIHTVNVLQNDYDPNGDPMYVTAIWQIEHGSASIFDSSIIEYTGPGVGFVGSFILYYNNSDLAMTTTGALFISITNQYLPVAQNITVSYYWISVSQGQEIQVLQNTIQPDGDSLTIFILTNVWPANVTVQADGSIFYQRTNWIGTQHIEYLVSDGIANATGFITVIVYDHAPFETKNQSITLSIFNPVSRLNILDFVSDIDQEDILLLSISNVSVPDTHLQVSFSGKNLIVNASNENFINTTYSIIYLTVSDGVLSATIPIYVTLLAMPPVSVFDITWTLSIPWYNQWNGTIITGFNGTLESIIQNGNHGSCIIENNSLLYKQDIGFIGIDYCKIKVLNPNETLNYYIVLQISDHINSIPSYSIDVHWRKLLTETVDITSFNNSNRNGPPLFIKSVSNGTYGFATIINQTSIHYWVIDPFLGTDTLVAIISDGLLNTLQFINIISTNQYAPEPFYVTILIHWRNWTLQGLSVPLTNGSMTEPDGDPLTASINNVINGPETENQTYVTSTNDLIAYHANWVGKENIYLSVSDGIQSATSTIQIISTNQAPIANYVYFQFHWRSIQGKQININAIQFDSDPDGDPLSYVPQALFTTKLGGSVEITTKDILYDAPLQVGNDSFFYSITDSQAESTSIVTISITNQNPVCYDVNVYVLWSQDQISIPLNCSDPDLDPLTFISLSLISVNSLIYKVPTVHYQDCNINSYCIKNFQIKYTASDSIATAPVAIVNIQVYDHRPQYQFVQFNVQRKYNSLNNFQVDLSRYTWDVDNNTVTVLQVMNTQNNVVQITGSLIIEYTPNPLFAGNDTVYYTISDGILNAQGQFNVNMINDAPICSNISASNLWKQESYQFPVSCTDANNDPLTYHIVQQGKKGIAKFVTNEKPIIEYESYARNSGNDWVFWAVSDPFISVIYVLHVEMTNHSPTLLSITSWNLKYPQNSFNPLQGVTDPDIGDSVVINKIESQNCQINVNNENNQVIIQQSSQTNQCIMTINYCDNDLFHPICIQNNISVLIEPKPTVNPVCNSQSFTSKQSSSTVISEQQLLSEAYDPAGSSNLFVQSVICNNTSSGPITQGEWGDFKDHYLIIKPPEQFCGTIYCDYTVCTEEDDRCGDGKIDVNYNDCKCMSPMDLVIVQDGSASITDYEWQLALQFSQKLVSKMQIESNQVWVGFVQFGAYASYDWGERRGFSMQKSDGVKEKIGKIQQFKSWTATLPGLELAVQVAQKEGRPNVPKTLLLITDGAANIPCSCSQCQQFYEPLGGNYNNCSAPNLYPGMDCSWCFWNPYEFPNSAQEPQAWCQPCADPRPFAHQINSWTNPNWKIVTVGIGSIPAIGNLIIQQSAYSPQATFSCSSWENVNAIYSTIVDQTCQYDMNQSSGDH